MRGYIARKMLRIFRECDSILQDAIDLENDLDALENAFDECDELIGPVIPKLFPTAQPTKKKHAEKMIDDLKQWIELEAMMEELENDPREVSEIFFEMRNCLARCEALSHVPMTRRQERLVSNLRDKVESCVFQQLEERFAKMQERAQAALDSLDRNRMKGIVTEFQNDKEASDRPCSQLDQIKVVLQEMDALDAKVLLALKTVDRNAMKTLLQEAKKYPASHMTSDMKECERLLALPEMDFCKLELEVAIRDKDERRRVHREIRLFEMDMDVQGKKFTGLMNCNYWRDANAWTKKASFFARLFGKDKIMESFKQYSPKPIHFPLTSFGFQPDDPNGDTPERRRQAVLCSKLILAYVSDGNSKYAVSANPDDPAKSVLSMALSDPPFREEVILQIIRILNNNPDPNSVSKGEELLGFCLLTFPLDKDFENYMYTWFAEKFGKDSPACKKHWAAMLTVRYAPAQRSPKSIGELRKEWNELVICRYALPVGKSSGPSPPDQMTLV